MTPRSRWTRWWRGVLKRLGLTGNPRREWLDPRMPRTLDEWRQR